MKTKHQLKVECFESLMDELVKWVEERGGNPNEYIRLLDIF
jgi:hypothetical protein